MKNTVEEIDRRITETEQQISKLEDRVVEIPVTEEKRMKKKKNEDNPRDLLEKKEKSLSRVWLFAIWHIIQSMEFSSPEYWSG